MPAICASVISGMAAKFTIRPAKVTRENTNAPIGSSAISAHADAANNAAGARSHGDGRKGARERRDAGEDAQRRAERKRESSVDGLQRLAQNRIAAVSAATFTGDARWSPSCTAK